MAESDPQERRKYARLNIRARVEYTVTGPGKPGTPSVSAARDLSLLGVRFLTPSKLSTGTLLEMRLFLPGKPDPLNIKGKVQWSAAADEKDSYWAGVEFLVETTTLRNLLIKFVCGTV